MTNKFEEWPAEELWGYILIHSQTEVAAFRNDMLAAAARTAGWNDCADSLMKWEDGWQHLGWGAFEDMYAAYKERTQRLWEEETRGCDCPCDEWWLLSAN